MLAQGKFQTRCVVDYSKTYAFYGVSQPLAVVFGSLGFVAWKGTVYVRLVADGKGRHTR